MKKLVIVAVVLAIAAVAVAAVFVHLVISSQPEPVERPELIVLVG